MPDSAAVVLPGTVDRFGGRAVHWVHQAGESPPVLLLGGCGVPYYTWDAVVALLPGIEVARMDRPGLGGTPWPGVLPRLADEVATLAELIDRLGTSVVVVAHSMAGLHAEALARLHPDRVAGLVLVDSSVEWSPKPPSGDAVWLTAARSVRAVMRVPVFRPLGSLADRLLTSAQSRRRVFDAVTPEAKEVYRSRDAVASVVAEQAAYGQQVLDLAALRATTPLPELPVTVLTAAADGGASWVDDQRRLADLLGGTQLVAEDSRHLIMIDRPDLVAAAVRTVRERATNREVPDD